MPAPKKVAPKGRKSARKPAAKAAPKAPRRTGRPTWKPTQAERDKIETMAGVGVPQEDIAKVIGRDAKTLRKHCAAELELGEIKANANVSGNLYKVATADPPLPSTVTAGIWWEKTRQGRKEISVTRHQGPNGGPMQTVDLTKATDEQLAALEAIFGPLAGASGDAPGDTGGEG